MTLTQLSYIVAVDTYRHFAKAAEHCFVSQPTLSMQIQKLEDDLGVIIFDRTKQPIEPSEIGKKIIEQARVVLRENQRIKDIIDIFSNKVAGEFRIGVIPTVAPYLVPLFIREFNERYPDVELIIDEIQTDTIIEKLQKDIIDVGILATPLNIQGLIEQPLYYEPFVAYLPDKHELIEKSEINADHLPIEDLLLLDEGNCFREQTIQLCKKYKDLSEKSGRRLRFEGGNLETLKKMVDKKLGVTVLPYLMVVDFEEERYKKRCVNFLKPTPKREISIVYSRNFIKQHITKALGKVIKATIPKNLLEKENSTILTFR